uniref:Uncharacterized protein n=1 Tax=Caenorhabditis japonica TaxID=281687 RepID=A0A8R1HG69_CAEJA
MSNVQQVLPDKVKLAKTDALGILENAFRMPIGEEFIWIAHQVLIGGETVLQPRVIAHAFLQECKLVLGDRTVESKTASDLAVYFSQIVNTDIDATGIQSTYANCKIHPGYAARMMAHLVVNRYMEYLETHHGYSRVVADVDASAEEAVNETSEKESSGTFSEDDQSSAESRSWIDVMKGMLNELSLDEAANADFMHDS